MNYTWLRFYYLYEEKKWITGKVNFDDGFLFI